MNDAERLRTRLMIASQKFAQEIAEAVLEATGQRDAVTEDEKPRKRRAPQRPPPVVGEVDPAAAKTAEAALAKIGIRRAV